MNLTSDTKSSLGFIISIGLVISAIIFGSFYYLAQTSTSNNSLSVTGSAKVHVTSDQAKLVVGIVHTVPVSGLSGGYASVAKDLAATKALLTQQGIETKDIVESPVLMNQVYDSNSSAETRYDLRQTVTLQSNDVQKLTNISKKIPSLASQGAIVSIQSLEYYYSKLPDLRVSLLGEAIKDAKARAEEIAKGTGRHVGTVRSASTGVVQVLPLNSVDISDYGTYDTSSIEKEIMVTTKATFGLK